MTRTPWTANSSVFLEFLGHRLAVALSSHFFRIGYILQLSPLLYSECTAIVQRPNGNSITTLLLVPLPESECPVHRGHPRCLPRHAQAPVGDPQHVPFSYSCNTPRPGRKENLFYLCVSSWNFYAWKYCYGLLLEEMIPQGRISTLRSPQQAHLAAGCQGASGALLRLVCEVAKPLRM